MTISQRVGISVGAVEVATSSNGPLPPEFWAERIVARLIVIGDNAPEPIRQQAWAYREAMLAVVLAGLKKAILSDRAYRPYREG